MRIKQICKAIVKTQYGPEYIIVYRPYKSDFLALPNSKIKIGTDPAVELKYELKTEYQLTTKFQRSLPDGWSRLLFLHNKDTALLTLYYIFYSEYTRQPRMTTSVEVVNLTQLNLKEVFKPEDSAALEYYLGMYGIMI